MEVPDKIRQIEDEIKKVRNLNEDVSNMLKWIVDTRIVLEKQKTTVKSPAQPATNGNDFAEQLVIS